MPRTKIVETVFNNKGCYVEARVAIVNVTNQRRTTVTIPFLIDTGFSGGIHIPHYYVNDARTLGIEPRPTTLKLGGGRQETSYICFGCLEKIDSYTFSPNEIETEIHLHGQDNHGYIGLEVLKNWITEFDGPSKTVNVCSN